MRWRWAGEGPSEAGVLSPSRSLDTFISAAGSTDQTCRRSLEKEHREFLTAFSCTPSSGPQTGQGPLAN